MKSLIALCLSLLAVAAAHAQGVRPDAHGSRSGGLRLGHASHGGHYRPGVPYRPSYFYRHGYGHRYSHYGHGYPGYVFYSGLGYAAGNAYYYGDSPVYSGGSYAGNGLLLGALAGAVIGNNSGDLRHNAWQGAALGATAGYLLGAIADHRESRATTGSERVAVEATAADQSVVADAPLAPAAPTAQAAPLAPASPMASANRLFGR